jgi:hypothetical protein
VKYTKNYLVNLLKTVCYNIGLNVVLAFCLGTDTQNILNSPIGQPMATVRAARIFEPLSFVFDSRFFYIDFI